MTVELKKMRKELKLTQKSMAKSMGVSLSMYEKVERGHKKASRNFMESLKKKYPEVIIDEVFF
ncbi:helix-turn-helix transcriptional regulator [Lysinibacillus sp. 1P01SD]|uniref:helix-turn-helix domain-containing protein n=1 Tax=Lysinibacillus sp. 1P01SD TaxID=3132285 RepID=UPI0039A28D03